MRPRRIRRPCGRRGRPPASGVPLSGRPPAPDRSGPRRPPTRRATPPRPRAASSGRLQLDDHDRPDGPGFSRAVPRHTGWSSPEPKRGTVTYRTHSAVSPRWPARYSLLYPAIVRAPCPCRSVSECNREANVTTTTQAAATRPAATVLVVSTAGFLASMDLFIVNIAFPEIRQTFGAADFGAMSWILNAYTLVFAAFMNPAGRLGDRYGHRRIFLCGLVVFTRLSRVRAVRVIRGAGRRPGRSGPGRRDADAEFARAAAGRRPGLPACRCSQHLVGGGGNGRRTRTSRWRIPSRIILALDLFRQRAGRAAGAGRRAPDPRETPRHR